MNEGPGDVVIRPWSNSVFDEESVYMEKKAGVKAEVHVCISWDGYGVGFGNGAEDLTNYE